MASSDNSKLPLTIESLQALNQRDLDFWMSEKARYEAEISGLKKKVNQLSQKLSKYERRSGWSK